MSTWIVNALRKPCRSQLSLSFRMLALFTIAACVLLSWVGRTLDRVRRQRDIVVSLESRGASVYFEQRRGSMLLSYLVEDAYAFAEDVWIHDHDSFQEHDFALLAGLPELKTLHLQGSRVTDRALQHVAQLPKLATLSLDSTRVTADGLAQLSALPELEWLDLAGETVSNDLLQRIGSLNKLRVVRFDGTRVTAAGCEHLADLPELRTLVFFRSSLDGLRFLDKLQGLEELLFIDTALDEEELRHVGALPNLRSLEFENTPIGDAGLRHLAELRQLERLDLTGACITDDGLAHLSGLTRLRELQLEQTYVSGHGLQHLAGLRELSELRLDDLLENSDEHAQRLGLVAAGSTSCAEIFMRRQPAPTPSQ